AEKPLKSKMAKVEPAIVLVNPGEGGPDITVFLTCSNLSDPGGSATPRVFLDRIEMPIDPARVTQTGNLTFIQFTTPGVADLPDGEYDVRVLSTSGQAATSLGAFKVVPPPVVDSIDPTSGSAAGGFTVTIRGSNFSESPNGMIVKYRNRATNQVVSPPITFTSVSATELQFEQPLKAVYPGIGSGEFYLQVENYVTHRNDESSMTMVLADTAAISRVTPGLVPILGGEMMYVKGSNFRSTDRVYLETAPNSGVYEDMTAIEAAPNSGIYDDMTAIESAAGRTTFQNPTLHQWLAPARQKGQYRVYVYDVPNGYTTPTRSFAYFQLADFTAAMGLAGGTDLFDGWTTALADFDKDPAAPGSLDLFVARKGAATIGTSSQTRVLRNNGLGAFTDVTGTAMPSVTNDDDWRADKLCVGDVDLDGYPDLVLATSSSVFPLQDTKSHVRILLNERR
ncbi:MAG: hypothetical protein FD127_4465, partial [Acidimicrobiaceae bacterium]